MIALLVTPLAGASMFYTNQALFLQALADNVVTNTPYLIPSGYPQRIISGKYLTVYERDVPASGTYDCQVTPNAPFCFVNGLYGQVSSTGVWSDHLFTKQPGDPSIVADVLSNATQLFMGNGTSTGFGTTISVGASNSPVEVVSTSASLTLPLGYQGFLGVLSTPDDPVTSVDFTDADASGVDISMTAPFTVQSAPEPMTTGLLALGLALVGVSAGIPYRASRRCRDRGLPGS